MNLEEKAKTIISDLKEREERILARRFGLFDYQKATLAKIGSDMNLTRERIRQIESSALKKLSQKSTLKKVNKVIKKVNKTINSLGGVVVISQAADKMLKKGERTKENVNALSLFLTLNSDLKISKKNQHFEKYWYDKKYDNKKIKQVANEYRKILKGLNKPLTIKKLIKEFTKSNLADKVKVNKEGLKQIIHIDKKIGLKDKRVGLMKWAAINPKSARDKAHLVLKEAGKPLHYRKIAKKIKEKDFYSTHNPTAPTVHNEVILDDRFVLIGRGIYALSEWGYQPGTVEEVITSILKKANKGLDRSKIIDKVMKQRNVAKNTVIANLNRSNKFKKQQNRTYILK